MLRAMSTLSRARESLRVTRLAVLDLTDTILRRRPPMVPPRREVHRIGGFDFLEIGRQLASIAIELGELKPHERIVDAGCGIGRLAVPLLDFLKDGEYAGFDIDRRGIAWCRKHIESAHANFHFSRIDVRNRHYNPRGAIAAEDLRFPYATGSVDLVFAASLFTHLTPGAGDHYLSEIARVLKPGGRFVGSFFLLNDQSRPMMGHTTPQLTAVDSQYAVQDEDDPERAIGLDERAVREALARYGVPVAEIRYGGWSFRSEFMSFQDFILARKP
ncbi:MAG: class I SAM-dependent methyltransferase [Thermoanaerobaculia bacterium]